MIPSWSAPDRATEGLSGKGKGHGRAAPGPWHAPEKPEQPDGHPHGRPPYYCSRKLDGNQKISNSSFPSFARPFPLKDPEIYVSRSEKKRQAKSIEAIAGELIELPPADVKKLPADDLLRTEILNSRGLKGGALKRQMKFIAKELRQMAELENLLSFLEQRRGSRLKEAGEFHELERLREEIISEAIIAREEAQRLSEQLNEQWQSETIAVACRKFPALDHRAVKISALRYAQTRKPVHRREIFRQLRAAMERERFARTSGGEGADTTSG